MRNHKLLTKPVNINAMSFEDLFDNSYDKIRHDWQKTPIRIHVSKCRYYKHKIHHA
jgi:hypothetical protein